jgi:hypothetical protein
MTRRRRLAGGIAVAAMITASAASAATPDKGTVGEGSPTVSCTGELQGSGTLYEAWAHDPTIPCPPGGSVCDPFILTVASQHNVTIRLNIDSENATGGDPGAGIRVTDPAGNSTYPQGHAGAKAQMVVKLKNL